MRLPKTIEAIIPALNEEESISAVVRGMLEHGAARVIVSDNGSTDTTAEVAREAGAIVVHEPVRGYGHACLAGMAALQDADIVVFADGDGCDDPADLPSIVAPIAEGAADLCIGSRMSGLAEQGSLPWHSRFGNRLGSSLIRILFGQKCTDMGPFRAIRRDALEALGMCERNFGWNVEMQAKAARSGLRTIEVPVHYHRRTTGKSKITGSPRKAIQAGLVIIATILKYRLRPP